MKKMFLYIMTFLGAVFSSCTTKDLGWEPDVEDTGTVEVELPEAGTPTDGTDAPFPETPEGYKLRCVLVSGGQRYEMVESEAVNNKFYFSEVGTDGETYVWADFIKEDAEPGEDGCYADLFYNTRSLPEVSYADAAMEDGSLFNNDACMAYYGYIADGGNAPLTLTLKSPLEKVTFLNKDAITVSGNIQVNYEVFNRFNIEEGAPEGKGTISYDGEVADRTGRVWFSNYLFADADGNSSIPGELISLTADGVTKGIHTDAISLNPGDGKQVNASFNWVDADVVINVDVGFDDPDAPRVGDYYYSDGTWSSDLKRNRTPIGVIFAVPGEGSAIDSDLPANYEGVDFADGEIHGWVLGLKECESSAFSAERLNDVEGVATASIIPTSFTTCDEIKGYANSQAWRAGAGDVALPALNNVADYELSAPSEGTSGWYIPALGQLVALREAYNEESSKVVAALTALNTDDGKADLMYSSDASGSGWYYWSSTYHTSGEELGLMRLIPQSGSTQFVSRAPSSTTGRHVRPILTF